jgi:hypothetical protein
MIDSKIVDSKILVNQKGGALSFLQSKAFLDSTTFSGNTGVNDGKVGDIIILDDLPSKAGGSLVKCSTGVHFCNGNGIVEVSKNGKDVNVNTDCLQNAQFDPLAKQCL